MVRFNDNYSRDCINIHSSLHDQALHMLDSHDNALRLHGALLAMQCHGGSMDRLDQILHLWTSVIHLVRAYFYVGLCHTEALNLNISSQCAS
jgi:hypothetical protein